MGEPARCLEWSRHPFHFIRSRHRLRDPGNRHVRYRQTTGSGGTNEGSREPRANKTGYNPVDKSDYFAGANALAIGHFLVNRRAQWS
jgi:hypothetical protein